MSASRRRRGVSFAEVLIVVVIGLILIGVVWELLRGATRIGKRSIEEISLQQGVRNVVENMVRDVSSAALIVSPNGQSPVPTAQLTLYRYSRPDASERAGLNQAQAQAGQLPQTGYPIGNMSTGSEHKVQVVQVSYVYDQGRQTVSRVYQAGTLMAMAPAERPRTIVDYRFEPQGGAPVAKELASNVAIFELFGAGYDPTGVDLLTGRGRIREVQALPPLPIQGVPQGAGPTGAPEYDRVACVILRIRSAFDQGAPRTVADDSSMEIVTKMWSYPKLYDHVYKPFFSSVDRDLRY